MPRANGRAPRTPRARLLLLAIAIPTAGCAGGSLEDILLGSPQQAGAGTLTAEVQEVRASQQQIVVRTEDGRQGAVLFDNSTQVVYQNQQYRVDALERGDVVDMRVQEVQQGLYTDLIQVRVTVQERQGQPAPGTQPGGTGQGVYAVEGTIGQIDTSRWTFTLDMTQGGTVLIQLPSSASSADRDRLRQYRAGDYVRVEIRPLDQQRAELVRFGWSG